MIWYVLLVCIPIIIASEIYSIIEGKPTRNSAIKRCVNRWAYLILGFGILFSLAIVWILAIIGNQELGQSTNADCIVMSDGFNVTFEIIMASFIIVVVLDCLNSLFRKKKLQVISIYFNWTEKLDKEGLFKYTDEEKAYNKAQDIEAKEKLRKWFPILKKLDKKV